MPPRKSIDTGEPPAPPWDDKSWSTERLDNILAQKPRSDQEKQIKAMVKEVTSDKETHDMALLWISTFMSGKAKLKIFVQVHWALSLRNVSEARSVFEANKKRTSGGSQRERPLPATSKKPVPLASTQSNTMKRARPLPEPAKVDKSPETTWQARKGTLPDTLRFSKKSKIHVCSPTSTESTTEPAPPDTGTADTARTSDRGIVGEPAPALAKNKTRYRGKQVKAKRRDIPRTAMTISHPTDASITKPSRALDAMKGHGSVDASIAKDGPRMPVIPNTPDTSADSIMADVSPPPPVPAQPGSTEEASASGSMEEVIVTAADQLDCHIGPRELMSSDSIMTDSLSLPQAEAGVLEESLMHRESTVTVDDLSNSSPSHPPLSPEYSPEFWTDYLHERFGDETSDPPSSPQPCQIDVLAVAPVPGIETTCPPSVNETASNSLGGLAPPENIHDSVDYVVPQAGNSEVSHPMDSNTVSDSLDRSLPSTILPPLPAAIDASAPLHKKPLPRRPPIWAETRQEVCESLDYFRSYQGGVYQRNGQVFGYLLDGYPSVRDEWQCGGKVIISHGGGKSSFQEFEDANGKKQLRFGLSDDQDSSSPTVRALIEASKTQKPLVLIAGKKYQLFPYDLSRCENFEHDISSCSFVILGWYIVTDAWAESEVGLPDPQGSTEQLGQFTRWKFRFQYLESQGGPWWADPTLDGAGRPTALSQAPQIDLGLRHVCPTCEGHSPLAFEEGPMCLRPKCTRFFKIGPTAETPIVLTYKATFFQLKSMSNISVPFDVRPSKGERPFLKGYFCHECGRLSCKEHWTRWKCRACGCKVDTMQPILKAEALQPSPLLELQLVEKIRPACGITSAPLNYKGIEGTVYHLPTENDKIYHIRCPDRAEADKIFIGYQEAANEVDIFQRYPMRRSKIGRVLSQHFSFNAGKPYRYATHTSTHSFENSPKSVSDALELIKRTTNRVLNRESESTPHDGNVVAKRVIPFNEVLSVAYFNETQKMNFHSDAERGLGNVVASLSMGSPAIMSFRKAHVRLQQASSKAEIAEAVSDTKAMRHTLINIVLRHGDILIMQGPQLQDTYEHRLQPKGFRFAATARNITESHLHGRS
ncbi:hypothetical protein BOTBODRAFT_61333 [Botryobasidium botryosum FD-172 SS1]|uniref:Fe2OG dioxygenase domain-containing protein n=1 Tax=Botryobasidium botryosum (strain FD-172 SS1) TaxID=930990 RepID=A0A067N115_BOTB1|nr:hypothetical protein BOTBODRAFT_61333 [Botryobasidium botryosum FD-172 SS1]